MSHETGVKNSLKGDFPALTKNPQLTYLDSAATTQKPRAVIDAVADVMKNGVANPHRGLYDLAVHATEQFEGVRAKVAEFIGADRPEEIVFTSGTTQGINLAAYSWGMNNLKPGDIVLLNDMEHHANYLPWQRVAKETGAELMYLSMDDEFQLGYKEYDIDFKNVKLIALSHGSNVLGTINPVADIVSYIRQQGATDAKIMVDAAQTVGHMPINVSDLQADFLAFSAHKMYGPSGVGVLWAKHDLLKSMPPYQLGGQMINSVSQNSVHWAEPPHKFEAGTQNLEGVIGLGASIDYLQSIGFDAIMAHDQELTAYGLQKLAGYDVYGPHTNHGRLPIFSLNVPGVHSHDASDILNRSDVAIRAGHHCAEPLMQRLAVPGTLRASCGIYTTTADIDRFVEGLENVKKVMNP